jgi:hypothetical protein
VASVSGLLIQPALRGEEQAICALCQWQSGDDCTAPADLPVSGASCTRGLEEADEDLRRVLVRKLKVQAVLSREADGRQVVDVSCIIDEKRFELRQPPGG